MVNLGHLIPCDLCENIHIFQMYPTIVESRTGITGTRMNLNNNRSW